MCRASHVGVRAWWLGVVMVMWMMCPARAWAGDRLNAARGEAGASSPSFGVVGVGTGDDDDDDDDWDDDEDEGIVINLFGAGSSDGRSRSIELDARRGFLPYPYADGRPGYMVRAAQDEVVHADTRQAVFRIGAEGAYLYEDVWRASAQLRFMVPRFYGEFRYDLMLEGPTPIVDGDVEVHGRVRDRLHFTNLELGPQLSAGEHLAVRMGVVGTLMFDDPRSLPVEPTMTPGVGGVLAFDLYPMRPLVFSGRGSISKLGETVMFEARATAGVSLRRLEVFAGYDHRQIGSVHLGGPTAGVAVRF